MRGTERERKNKPKMLRDKITEVLVEVNVVA